MCVCVRVVRVRCGFGEWKASTWMPSWSVLPVSLSNVETDLQSGSWFFILWLLKMCELVVRCRKWKLVCLFCLREDASFDGSESVSHVSLRGTRCRRTDLATYLWGYLTGGCRGQGCGRGKSKSWGRGQGCFREGCCRKSCCRCEGSNPSSRLFYNMCFFWVRVWDPTLQIVRSHMCVHAYGKGTLSF